MLKLPALSETGMCYMIQRLNSYNLLTDKVAGKVIWTNYRQDEKS